MTKEVTRMTRVRVLPDPDNDLAFHGPGVLTLRFNEGGFDVVRLDAGPTVMVPTAKVVDA